MIEKYIERAMFSTHTVRNYRPSMERTGSGGILTRSQSRNIEVNDNRMLLYRGLLPVLLPLKFLHDLLSNSLFQVLQ